jgi:hypothetical protein
MMQPMASAEEEQEITAGYAQLEAAGVPVRALTYTKSDFTFVLTRISDVPRALQVLPPQLGGHVMKVELHLRRHLLVFDHWSRGVKLSLFVARLVNGSDKTAGYH